MNLLLPDTEIDLINEHLCLAFGSAPGYRPDGQDHLRAQIAEINGDAVHEVAAKLYVAIVRTQPFVSLNEATAFGSMNAMLSLHFMALSQDIEPRMDILRPAQWGDAEFNILSNWIMENSQREEGQTDA